MTSQTRYNRIAGENAKFSLKTIGIGAKDVVTP